MLMGDGVGEEFKLRRLYLPDVKKAMVLSRHENWNQTEKDWTFLIENAQHACIGAFDDDRLIGTVTVLNYDHVSWIGMMLVDKSYRGRGLSKMLLSNVIKDIGPDSFIKLDATPAGQKVYVKFGFQIAYEVHRMTASKVSLKTLNYSQNNSIRPILNSDISNVCTFDERAFGDNRKGLMEFLFMNNQKKSFIFEKNGEIEGFVLGREGSNYYHIGPLMASSAEIAKALMFEVLQALKSQPVLLDVTGDKKEILHWLEDRGFKKQRGFIRMYQNENLASGLIPRHYLIAGPEYG